MDFIKIYNNQSVKENTIPVLPYSLFLEGITDMMKDHPERHCLTYFGVPWNGHIRLFCCIADDVLHDITVSSSIVTPGEILEAFSAINYNFEKFEREIHENFGIGYRNHPWLKPVRYAYNRHDLSQKISNYPFFSIDSEELHEVGVGPVHAGIIEPGHFRFVCNGEQILHLEIQLGYQHRGVEDLFLKKNKLIQRSVLAESIAGDSVIEHASAFAYLTELLSGMKFNDETLFTRTISQEIERIAIHTGDLSAICTDVAYQLGSAVFGRLRTPVINFLQEWCGNRLGKGLVRAGFNPWPFTPHLSERLSSILDAFQPDFTLMNNELSKLPSSLSRFEKTGIMRYEHLLEIGAVGMAARMNSLERDIRKSHPYGVYKMLNHVPVVKHHGDVYSRVQIRKEEVLQSISYIRELLKDIPANKTSRIQSVKLQPGMFAISAAEGWRGEVCHAAITGDDGELRIYKVKDPSFHNWFALALAVRNNEISDFPVCNKSFDLSYCGHDL
ncbi:MAG TPA: hypothetical protein VK213_12555 [Bacteroidales bacterium]|nr:hypothetical protein [Bacteroidales bacterium]